MCLWESRWVSECVFRGRVGKWIGTWVERRMSKWENGKMGEGCKEKEYPPCVILLRTLEEA